MVFAYVVVCVDSAIQVSVNVFVRLNNSAELFRSDRARQHGKSGPVISERGSLRGVILPRTKLGCDHMYPKKTCFSEVAGSFVNILCSWHKIEDVPFSFSDKVIFRSNCMSYHKWKFLNK
jgi:hypothetical protein